MQDNKLSFDENGKFKIMQIADIQETACVSPDTLRLIRLALEKEKPDLAVLTGDQIYGIHPSFYMGNRTLKAKNTICEIIKPFEELNIPFAVTFGNHDCQVGLTNAEQADIYSSCEMCIHGEYAAEDDKGTFRLPIYDGDTHIFDVFLIDSNGQSITGEYLPVSEKQLNWYKNEREIAKENGKYTPTLVFQHIPVPEFFDVIKQVKRGTRGAVEAFRNYKGKFYVLPEEIKNAGGFMHESPAVPDVNSGEFSVLAEKGNVLALAVGHDHINSFVAQKDNIKLIYTQCAGFNVYGPKLKRGVRIFELDKNDLSKFETYTLTYDELTTQKLSSPVKEFVLTHIPTSMEQVKRLAAVGLGVGSVCLSLGAVAFFKYREK